MDRAKLYQMIQEVIEAVEDLNLVDDLSGKSCRDSINLRDKLDAILEYINNN